MLTRRNGATVAVAALGAWLVAAPVAEARVTKITIMSTTPAFDGRVFGNAGAYEQVRGTAAGELDPQDPLNAVITDINLAQRNANGMVTYTATFTLRKPVNMSKASGTLVYEVNNRGNHIFENNGFFNIGVTATNPPETASSTTPETSTCGAAGRATWCSIRRPPRNRSTCRSRRIPTVFDHRADLRPLRDGAGQRQHTDAARAGPHSREPRHDEGEADLHRAREQLGVRTGVVEIGNSDWAFASCATTPFPGTPSSTQICLRNGFDPNLAYELVYTAKDPLVLGVGMAAMRDVVSFFRTPGPPPATRSGRDQVGDRLWISSPAGTRRPSSCWASMRTRTAEGSGTAPTPTSAVRWASSTSASPQPGNIANIFEPGAEGPCGGRITTTRRAGAA